jgi:hypothetical protein
MDKAICPVPLLPCQEYTASLAITLTIFLLVSSTSARTRFDMSNFPHNHVIIVWFCVNWPACFQGLIAYQLSDPFAQVECLLPEGRIGVQASLTRWNTTTDYREKPVFRFDGRFVCSVQKMSAGGHHTCLIYGTVFARIAWLFILFWNPSTIHLSIYKEHIHQLAVTQYILNLHWQVTTRAPTAIMATSSALAGTITTRRMCRSV